MTTTPTTTTSEAAAMTTNPTVPFASTLERVLDTMDQFCGIIAHNATEVAYHDTARVLAHDPVDGSDRAVGVAAGALAALMDHDGRVDMSEAVAQVLEMLGLDDLANAVLGVDGPR